MLINPGTFEIVDPRGLSPTDHARILVPLEEKDSEPVFFLLKAKSKGDQYINVHLYQEGLCLGRIKIKSLVITCASIYAA